jgi:hypothetical protein
VTLTFLSIPNDVGPGYPVTVLGILGPVPVDDTLVVYLLNHVTGQNFTYGQSTNLSAGAGSVVIGYDDVLKRIASGQGFRSNDGVAIDAYAVQNHANGTVVDTSAVTPYGNLDLFTYTWTLIQYGGGANSPFVSDILAAVRQIFTPTQ